MELRRGSAWRLAGDALHPLLGWSVHRTDAAASSRSSWATLTRTVIIRMNGPDPAQAKSNTSGNTRTTVHAQRAYTIT
jgi:hypothetical protein